MRHLLVALMIVLLPLRGWMGDAMAISMAGMQLGANEQTHAAVAQPGEHEDCAGMSMATSASPDTSAETADAMTGCESCPVCQACSIVVMGADPLRTATPFIPQAAPVGALPHFASAHAQRWHKPPIS